MGMSDISSVIGRGGGEYSGSGATQLYSKSMRASASASIFSQESRGVSGEDRVELSENAPRPINAKEFEDAIRLGEQLSDSAEDIPLDDIVRYDRVFVAMAVLSAGYSSGDTPPLGWSSGLPSPTKAEIATAYRRLNQRLREVEGTEDQTMVQEMRSRIIDEYRGEDFSRFDSWFSN